MPLYLQLLGWVSFLFKNINSTQRFFFLLLYILTFTKETQAIENETIGDALLLLIPTVAYGSTLYLDDTQGEYQYYKSFAANSVVTLTLKYGVNRTRPNGEPYSFPSGHSSITFQSASFIHFRYGLSYAILPYLGAAFTAYSRVDADKHYVSDVIAGASIGILSSYLFTKKYKNIQIQPLSYNNYYGLVFSKSF